MLSARSPFYIERHRRVKSNGLEKDILNKHEWRENWRNRVILDTGDFRTRSIIRDKWGTI